MSIRQLLTCIREGVRPVSVDKATPFQKGFGCGFVIGLALAFFWAAAWFM